MIAPVVLGATVLYRTRAGLRAVVLDRAREPYVTFMLTRRRGHWLVQAIGI